MRRRTAGLLAPSDCSAGRRFNQEVLRLKSFEEDKTSLIRSFPSKVGVIALMRTCKSKTRTYEDSSEIPTVRRFARVAGWLGGWDGTSEPVPLDRPAVMILSGKKQSCLDFILSSMGSSKGPLQGFGCVAPASG